MSVDFFSQPEEREEYKGLRRWGIFAANVFGPVKSRRFGRSLGINPLPIDEKVCSFDCPYCECGRTLKEMNELLRSSFPPVDKLESELRNALSQLKNELPDTLTITGNGEPTLHPKFEQVVEMTLRCREELTPSSKIAILTNGTTMGSERIAAALNSVDIVMLKLDAGSEETMNKINAPLVFWTPEKVKTLAGKLNRIIIQSIFLQGSVDNTSEKEIQSWLKCIAEIGPQSVVVYTLDRVPSAIGLKAVSKDFLKTILKQVNSLGINCEII